MSLVPKKWLEDINYDLSYFYTEEGYYCASSAWEKYPPKKDALLFLSNIFPKSESLPLEYEEWRDKKENDIQLMYEDKKIVELSVRLNLYEDSLKFLPKVVEIANELDCVIFLRNEKKVIEPNVFELNRAAKNSNAMKFANDPEGFLKSIKTD